MCYIHREWHTYSIKKQLNITFSLLIFGSFIAIAVPIIIYLAVISNNIEKLMTDHLLTQAQNNMQNVNIDASNLFDKKLDKLSKNFMAPTTYALEDTYRLDYPYYDMQWYYNWQPFMKPPTVFSTRYNSYVSYANGDISVSDYTPYNTNTLTSTINSTLSRTESVDQLLKALYFETTQVISLYACLQQNKIFREYPAVSNGNYNQLTSYDCTVDDWYQKGLQIQHVSQYTNAYVDNWLHLVMITIVRSIHNTETGQYIGTVGNDMLTDAFQQSISEIKFLTNGRAIFFDVSNPIYGYIIADSSLGLTNTELTQLINYDKIKGIAISADVWQQITSQTSSFVELDSYYIQSVYLKTGNKQYILSIFTLIDDVQSPIKPIQNQIRDNNMITGVIIGSVFIAVLCIVLIVMYFLIIQISQTLGELIGVSQKVASNIGGLQGAFEGVKLGENQSSITETKELRNNFITMMQKLSDDNKQKKTNGLCVNQHYIKDASQRSHNTYPQVTYHEEEKYQIPSAPTSQYAPAPVYSYPPPSY